MLRISISTQLKDEVKPVFIYKNKDWWAKRIFVKLEPGNHFQVVDNIVELVKKNSPGFPVNYMFLDQEADKYYDNERKLSTLINAATFLTIVISCIGLFSLTAFTIRKKTEGDRYKESLWCNYPCSVMIMLQKDYGKLLLISSLIALPGWILHYNPMVGIICKSYSFNTGLFYYSFSDNCSDYSTNPGFSYNQSCLYESG